MTRSTPRRTCVNCRANAPAANLVRLRWTQRGLAVGKGPGRGAWLCATDPMRCLERAARTPTLARALRAPVTNDDLVRVRATLGAGARHPEPARASHEPAGDEQTSSE